MATFMEKDVLIELISHILGLTSKTVEFENKWKEYTGHRNAHFLNSATVGLHLAVEILKKENYSRGVVIRQEEEGVAVDVYIIVGYGTKISAICRNVQEQVKYNLETMLGFSANTVNVYVQGVKIIEA